MKRVKAIFILMASVLLLVFSFHLFDDARKPASPPSQMRPVEPKTTVLAGQIEAIDAQLEAGNWVERSNQGKLSNQELEKFRGLLEQRNKLFEEKIEQDLQGT